MLEVNMLMDLGNGTSVVGTPGYLSPVDKARLDELWSDRGGTVSLSYAGDVEGYTQADGSGNVFAVLTVPELENIRAELTAMRTRLEEMESSTIDLSPITDRLNEVEAQLSGLSEGTETEDRLNEAAARLNEVEARLDAQEDEQREYMRRVDFDSSTGVLSFKDGYNEAVYTVGGATYEPVTVEPDTLEG